MKNGREAASALKKRESKCFKDGNRICIKLLIYITFKAVQGGQNLSLSCDLLKLGEIHVGKGKSSVRWNFCHPKQLNPIIFSYKLNPIVLKVTN